MQHFILVRHGESQLNVVNRQSRVFCGQVDTPLTERGREQARTAGKVLAAWADLRISTAISSALGRCRESLDLMLQELPYDVQRLADSPALNERSLGAFEGCQADAVYARYPPYRDDPNLNQFDRHFVQKAPGGENLREVTERAWAVIERLDKLREDNVLIVSHYTTIRCILGRALDLPEAAITRLQVPNAVPLVLERGNAYRLVDGTQVLEA
jgi:broad specificity phosphatase PhoE